MIFRIKIWTDLSSVLSQSTRLTDRQTDRQTDGRTDSFLIARPRLHSMQRGENEHRKLTLAETDTKLQNTGLVAFYDIQPVDGGSGSIFITRARYGVQQRKRYEFL